MDNATETIDAATEPDAAEDSPSTDQQTDTGNDANSEARSWRLKLRAAETNLAVANARIAEQNRLHAERVLSYRLADPSDAWANGADLASMLNDDGLIDEDAVLAYADSLLQAKPHYAAKLKPVGAPASAVTADDPIPTANQTPSWQDILTGGNTG